MPCMDYQKRGKINIQKYFVNDLMSQKVQQFMQDLKYDISISLVQTFAEKAYLHILVPPPR